MAAGEPAGGPAWADPPIGLPDVTDGFAAAEAAGRAELVGAGWDTLVAGPRGGDWLPARGPAVGSEGLKTVPATSFAGGVMVAAIALVTVPTVLRPAPVAGATTPLIVLSAGTTVPPPTPVTVVTVVLRTVVTFGATGTGVCGDTVDVAADTRFVTVCESVRAPGAGGLGPAGSMAEAVLDTVCGAGAAVLETVRDTVRCVEATAVDTVCGADATVLEMACDTV